MPPVKIAVDIDEVLCPFLSTMTKWKYPKFKSPAKHPYNYSKLFGISRAESKKMVDQFYFTHDFKNMKPFPESQVFLRMLKNNDFVIYAVTGRQSLVRSGTQEWLYEHYPGIFKDVYLTNSFTPWEIDKSLICSKLRVSSIVDDNYDTCIQCLENGITPINYIGDPVYPWCNEGEYSEKTWKGVYSRLVSDNSTI